mgnify:CR=1 FL=1
MAGDVQMRKQTIGLAGALMLCGIGMLTGCGARGLEQAYSFQEREAQMTPAAGAGLAPFFASSLCVPESADGDIAPDDAVTAQAGALFDVTDSSVIYGKNIYDQMYPASITKVMTAIIAIEEGNLSDAVTANDDVVIREAGASMAGIKPGDTFTLEQLLYGLMIPSGNDAGAAIAVHMAGSIDAFAELMNREAQKLGATGTHFMNPHGLTNADHYTTAYDLYLIFNEALKQPEFRKVTGTTSYTADYTDGSGNPVSTTWEGGNWYMVGQRQTPDGLTVFSGKTGTTSAAGFCLIMASRDQKEKEYISVVLKAPSRPGLYDNMTNIISKIVD